MMKKLKRALKSVPFVSKALFFLFFVCVLLHVAFLLFGAFAEWFNETVGAFIRSLFATVTNILPVSAAEILIILSPVIVVVFIVIVCKISNKKTAIIRIISAFASLGIFIYSMFVLTFASGFYSCDIGERFELNRRDITVQELYDAALIVARMTNSSYELIGEQGSGATYMNMTYDELSKKVSDSFLRVSEEYGYPVKMNGRMKPVMLSRPMTYSHISGVYTFFTGEENVNVNYPDFVIPYTAAHEMSHQRGVSREDEANFLAFLVCITSDDPYIKYSGYLNMYEYMASAVYSADPELYGELSECLCDGVKSELAAYSEFFDEYRDNAIADVSDAVNDTYLTVMSGNDTRSYGMVVDLATLYLLNK